MKDTVELWIRHPDIDKIEVSSFGRVRSVNGHYYKSRSDKNGYMRLHFHMNGKHVFKLVHRLVAETFIPNPNNLPQINHKDNDRTNNNVSNLEWCTASYNVQYREKYGKSQAEAAGHPLFAINLVTLEVSHFRSQNEAGQALGVYRQSINAVLKGRYKQAHGFWFVNDDENANAAIENKLHDIKEKHLEVK